MKTLFYTLFVVLLSFPAFSQDEEEEYVEEEETEEEIPASSRELGADLNFSASNFGGTGGLGLKLGFIIKEQFIGGPSIRFQQSWSNGLGLNGAQGVKSSFAVYGAGGFIHARLLNYFFVGAEVELLSTPFQNGYLMAQRIWVPTALVGGGFSRAFSPNFRLNAGIMYDVINHVNSPFRQGYFMKRANGTYIPVMYRIAFFFPI
ncbi:MAG: hypothetical protein A3D31_05070 [Candidatus Fluviicola riflensis]|nr:MAG: hypothetical protein CHH17_09945 [Candidatus Fluviicola riflensis]OGS79345.1 MAG: hypothetical protein A3D31_05070 [Candidatus Fluviicola riflensis]OGS86777.1 MAG: hypothetical protein A2724_04530 [Fluviicola sp. RIFCSPHIGHO2_01_FULL_43_53]OGS88750.1 MAG: hypothetical protein A3E30_00130 [Fluviicola sp. RIFCSPHIGHO2_12_FULL_43_24]